MLKLNREGLMDAEAWKKAGIALPAFDIDEMVRETEKTPEWVHFGAGNIFRVFPALMQQKLLDAGWAKTGIIAVKTYDWQTIGTMYAPFDNLSLAVIMEPDGRLDMTVVASICVTLAGDPACEKDWERLQEIFRAPSLQMVSFTITEKGYSLRTPSGELSPEIAADLEKGPASPGHVMSKTAALAYARFRAGAFPLAFVSMDNCARNGDKLKESLGEIARGWAENGLVEEMFVRWLTESPKVSFPWTMIDKITPRPSDRVRNRLNALGLGTGDTLHTEKHAFIAPFVNAERSEYLVIEDSFPNGRPPLERAGAYFTDRLTVDRVERMKVGTCLNPLHTALAVFGCLLGYTLIADEMKDPDLKRLVEKIGYVEGIPVAEDPGIIHPLDFLREVIEERLPNPNIPDTPQRIAMDTSQKVGIRFGGTIRAYRDREGLDPADLTFIPLTLAAWCRYLMGLNDRGEEMALSPDPLLETLRPHLAAVRLGEPSSAKGVLRPILSDRGIFTVDLYEVGLGEKIEGYFAEMIAGPGAVRNTLRKYLG
ncbi:MAG: fructuronate reductase [Synergistaceae bacterium]|nr:fructuronate reductase [Synergistaceae bacterium]